jgi:hypothetical protein
MASSQPKRLEGVAANDALCALLEDCHLLCQNETKPLLTSVSTDSSHGSPASHHTNSTTNAAAATVGVIGPMTLEEARTVILDFCATTTTVQDNKKKKKKKKEKPAMETLPLAVIRAMKVVFQSTAAAENNNDSNDNKIEQLETALSQSHLKFTSNATTSDTSLSREQKKFRERMERLRLQNEESNYYKLTSNIGNRKTLDDEITTKSMTYAASIGLNMIVAPLSFGIFMYYFSGPILNFVWKRVETPHNTHPGAVDIRKVIIGVISGVAMLFIEMLLFVIRTHEFDRGLRKKQKKKGSSIKPFGEYSATSSRTYKSE